MMKSFRNVVFIVITISYSCAAQQTEPPPQIGDLRLRGPGSNSTHGRVEIFYNNEWGTVCDDNFGSNEATVVCRQLGHSPAGATPLDSKIYGPGTGPIWIDNVDCQAVEFRLIDCTLGGWNRSDCTHAEDVGLACLSTPTTPSPVTLPPATPAPVEPEDGNCSTPDSTIRLQSPTNREGMGVVQIFRNGIWGNICDNNWDINDARVVCRMLCYNVSDAVSGGGDIDTSNITAPMVIDSMDCVGNEKNISDCPQSAWANNSCGRNEMATVTCVPVNTESVRPQPVLQCTNGRLTSSFSTVKDIHLKQEHLTIAYNYTGQCNLVWANSSTDLSIGIPFDQCGTRKVTNETHIIYNNTIKYASTYTSANGQITFANTYMIEVKCELPKEVVADKPIVPITETVTQSAQGEFITALQFFRSPNFDSPETVFPLEIPLGEYLYPAITLEDVDSTLRLVVHNCTATPTANRNDPIRYNLILNKCAEDSTVSQHPINNTLWGWGYKTFKFVVSSEVHLHCDALICGIEETDPVCDRSCFRQTTSTTTTSPAGRKKRSSSRGIRSVHISSATIIMYDPNQPVQIERPPYTVLPETQTTISSTTKHKSSTQPSVAQETSTNKHETPPTSQSNQSAVTQTPPPISFPNSSDQSADIVNIPDIEAGTVLSKASVFMFSLFSLSQFVLCLILFYVLI